MNILIVNYLKRPKVALAVSRALGDREFKIPKAIVSCVPSVQTFELSPDDTHLLLVCDGLTDVRPASRRGGSTADGLFLSVSHPRKCLFVVSHRGPRQRLQVLRPQDLVSIARLAAEPKEAASKLVNEAYNRKCAA